MDRSKSIFIFFQGKFFDKINLNFFPKSIFIFFQGNFFEQKYFFRIFGENLVALAQKMAELFNLGTDRQTD